MNQNERLVIVGGGPAGLSTARSYRKAGGEGRVTILTTEAYPPYNRPPLTKEYLRGELAQKELSLEKPGWYEENGIELRLETRVTTLHPDRRVVETEDAEEIPYDALVLATGSEPIRIPIPGADDPDILTMRTVEDSNRLQGRAVEGSRAVVAGSGFIGCEAAASLSLRGADVTLISLEESPQKERLGDEVAGHIQGWLEGYGVDLRLGAGIESIESRDGGYEVSIEGGEMVPADTVLFGTGVRARTGLAESAGLHLDGGVVTDYSMRASVPGIFAVGDIARAYNESARRHLSVEHWGDALEHGRIAGTVIAGGKTAWKMAPGFWSTIGERTLKYWAWGDGWDELRFKENGESFVARYGKDGVLVGILAHGADEEYEAGRQEIEGGASFPG